MKEMHAILLGNPCHDTLINPHGTSFGQTARETQCLGGSVSYISKVLTALNVPHKTIGKVGSDFKYFHELGFEPIVDPHQSTTHFIDDYRSGKREATVPKLGSQIFSEDFKAVLGDSRARIGIACGVANELTEEAILELRRRVDLLICDAQGLIRRIDPKTQKMFHVPLRGSWSKDALHAIDILKTSEDEDEWVDSSLFRNNTRFVKTRGKNGATVISGGRSKEIAGFPAEEVDATGAGDCFVAGLTYGLLEGRSLEEAVRLGNRLGALAVTQVGVPEISLSHV